MPGGALCTPAAVGLLVLALYHTLELFTQIRCALVASGPTAEAELRAMLRGEHAVANQLIQAKHLDRYCGEHDDAPPAQCQPVSACDFYAAVVLGDFYDPAAVGDLLAVLVDARVRRGWPLPFVPRVVVQGSRASQPRAFPT